MAKDEKKAHEHHESATAVADPVPPVPDVPLDRVEQIIIDLLAAMDKHGRYGINQEDSALLTARLQALMTPPAK